MGHIFKGTDRAIEALGQARSSRWFLHFIAAGTVAMLTPVMLHALNLSSPPGSNFNLSVWNLTLPIGSSGEPDTISNTALKDGFTDSYFFTNTSDGSMALKDPESNCVTTPNSEDCHWS